jgi:F-type H+-transporting ATPase subunit b
MIRLKSLLTLIVVFVLAPVVLASSGGGGEHEGSILMGYVWQILNFSILMALLIGFGRKPIKEFFKTRTETIKKGLDEAREAKELAQKALDEVREKFNAKDKEIEEIISASTRSGEKEKERLLADGERLSNALLEQTKANIDFELKQAREAIMAEAVELAMELAEKKIQSKMDEGQQKKLFEEALKKLEDKN